MADYQYYTKPRYTVGSKVAIALLLLAFVLCISGAVYILYTYQQGEAEYDSLVDQYFELPTQESYSTRSELEEFKVDWDALREINPDIVGWIYVPSTSINYPIVWREGDDEYYLKHTFTGQSENNFGADYGCIMLSGVNAGDWSDQLNIIYGHHMANNSMFAPLAQLYQNSVLFNETRWFYLLTPEKNYKLKSFALEKVEETDESIVIPNFESTEEMQEYIQKRLIRSSVNPIETKIITTSWNKLFAFSTCSEPDNENRLITFCYVDDEWEVEASDAGQDADTDSADVAGEGSEGAATDEGGEGITGGAGEGIAADVAAAGEAAVADAALEAASG